MADSGNQTPSPDKPKKEVSMEQRLLLTFVLMGLVLIASQYLFKAPPRPNVKQTEPAKPAQQAAKPQAPPPLTATATPTPQVAAQKEETFRVDTDVYSIEFTNAGAQVKSWILRKYTTTEGKPIDLVNQPGAAALKQDPFAIIVTDPKFPDVNHALYAATPAPDRLGVDYEFSDGRVTVRKTFRFTKTGYLSQVSTEVLSGAVPVPHYIAWRGGFGDPSAANATSQQQAVYYDVAATKLVKNDAKAAKDGPVTASGNFTFAGLQDAYFAAVFLPRDANSIEARTVSDSVPATYSAEAQPHVGAEVGGAPVNRFAVFVGPKDLDLLRSVDPRLEQLVDFGKYFGVIAKPLFLAVNWFNDRFIHDYGWSIVVVTVIINLLMFPLRLSSMKSMRKMAALQPQIAAINERYKGIGLRDPKKAQQNQEMMDLYKRNGVNPIGGGCFPMLLQLPFFIAFYTVLTVAIEMRGAHWLWISDLSRHDPFYLLPLIMIVTQVVVQRMTPQTSMDPAQQKIMMFMMPLMMGFFFMQAAAGLVLYWVTGNLMSLAQQWFFNRITPAPAPAVVDVKPVGKKSRK